MATDLDGDFAEVNMNDLVETTISAFAQLLLSKAKMKVRHLFFQQLTNISFIITLQFIVYLSLI